MSKSSQNKSEIVGSAQYSCMVTVAKYLKISIPFFKN